MNQHETINYIELPARDLPGTKAFYRDVFGWQFVDYGPEYMAFSEANLSGGFYLSEHNSSSANGAALIVFYSRDLESTQKKIERAGGQVIVPTFEFPGGRRFQFTDPNGNELAVWSDKAV